MILVMSDHNTRMEMQKDPKILSLAGLVECYSIMLYAGLNRLILDYGRLLWTIQPGYGSNSQVYLLVTLPNFVSYATNPHISILIER